MALSWDTIRQNAVSFAASFRETAREEAAAQVFLIRFLKVFGQDFDALHAEGAADFECKVPLADGHTGYIDFLWRGKLLVEMKSRGKSLDEAMRQAERYLLSLSAADIPPIVMVSDFESIWVKVRELQKTQKFKTEKLYEHVKLFADIAGYEAGLGFDDAPQIEANVKASRIMAELHDALKNYGYSAHELEVYLVRILFCLFAENTGIFESGSFKSYVRRSREDGSDLRARLDELFEMLDTPDDDPSRAALPAELAQFRYIDGRLFEEKLRKPVFDGRARKKLLDACDFNWSSISPAVFGAMFQGVMDEKLRREMGAHYTSEENILKVIRPLFLDELWEEFRRVRYSKESLEAFHQKIASLKFFDPACGCGNFLIIAYRELRKLEYAVLAMLVEDRQLHLDVAQRFKVNVNQFCGIELEEFPCHIAQTGMWLMEHQMNMQAAAQLGAYYIDLPLRSSAVIVNANALELDWESVAPKGELSYIMGNPPFNGGRTMTQAQKKDMAAVFGEKYHGVGNLDYVCAWYKKAASLIKGTGIRAGFVSTNSISQGEQPALLWKPLEEEGIKIDFAYRTFRWINEGSGMAAVHCVIIGFSDASVKVKKLLFEGDATGEGDGKEVSNINGYLLDAPNVYVESRTKPLCPVPPIGIGNKPIDGGFYLFSDEEKEEFIRKEPASAKWFRLWLGADEFINGYHRWCLRLKECPPDELKKMPEALKRVEAVRQYRLKSKSAGTRKLAERPLSFHVENIPNGNYIVIPRVSSERRYYVPIGFLDASTLVSDSVHIIPNATLYHFGVLTSIVHMAWMRAVCGRLEMRYRYSKDIVYNNFPWPQPTEKQQAEIEAAAQGVLDARAEFPNSPLAALYDPNTMPDVLYKAHKRVDRAVMKAYGKTWQTEGEMVAELMGLYMGLVSGQRSTDYSRL